MGRKPKAAAKPAAKVAAKTAAKVAVKPAEQESKISQKQYDAFLESLKGVGRRCVVSIKADDGSTITLPEVPAAEIYQVVIDAHRSVVA